MICPVQEPTADTSITLAEGEESSMGGQAFCLRRRLHISMQESDVQHDSADPDVLQYEMLALTHGHGRPGSGHGTFPSP